MTKKLGNGQITDERDADDHGGRLHDPVDPPVPQHPFAGAGYSSFVYPLFTLFTQVEAVTDEPSATSPDFSQMSDDWWRSVQRQAVEHVRKTGTTAGLPAEGPAVVVTITGAKSGIKRQVPLLRAEHEGRYVIAASKGGSSREPVWAANLRVNPDVTVQDGEVTRDFSAREVTGSEREMWWQRVVAAEPAIARYAAATDRPIALFVLDPA